MEVTTRPIDYKLDVVYEFSDGSKHEGFENYTVDKSYHIGESYKVPVPDAPAGYTFDEAASSDTTGTFDARNVIVTLVYTANDKVTARVQFQDAEGNILRNDEVRSGLVGQNYDLSTALAINEITANGVRYGFVDDGVDDAAYTGTLPADGVTIIRTYEPLPTYTVTYAPGAHGIFEAQTTSGLYFGDNTPAFDGTPNGETGWVFAGWDEEIATTVTGDVTYTAQWKEMPKFTVVYELWTSHNGGGYELTDTVTALETEYVRPGIQGWNAPETYGEGYKLDDEGFKTTGELTYGDNATLTFRYERQTFGSVNYTIKHVYRTITGDAGTVKQDGYLDVPASGTHSDVVYAANVEAKPDYEGKRYTFNAAASDESITLNGSAGQTITLVYDRYVYVVTVNGDEGVASTTGQGTYEKGSNVTVNWTLNTGYELASVSVNDEDHPPQPGGPDQPEQGYHRHHQDQEDRLHRHLLRGRREVRRG